MSRIDPAKPNIFGKQTQRKQTDAVRFIQRTGHIIMASRSRESHCWNGRSWHDRVSLDYNYRYLFPARNDFDASTLSVDVFQITRT